MFMFQATQKCRPKEFLVSSCALAGKAFALLIFSLLLTATSSIAASIQLAWAPNLDTNLAGYRLYKRLMPQGFDYTTYQWQGTETASSATVDLGATYCFVVRAYSTSGIESGDSNEVCYRLNSPPIATSQAVSTYEDVSMPIKIDAMDVDGNALAFTLVTAPSYGSLAGSAPSFTYSPKPNFSGADSFTFKANDGQADSGVATVSITVAPVNDAPVAFGQTIGMTEGTVLNATLSATDVDGDRLQYAIAVNASKGVATVVDSATGSFTYKPNPYVSGSDSFTFNASDGKAASQPATVSLTIAAANYPPTAVSQAVSTAEDTSVSVILSGSDVNGDALTYRIVGLPGHGTLSGTSPNLIYKPQANYNGPDSVVFVANDGKADSNSAAVSITVTPVNDSPVAEAGPDQIVDETAVVTLRGTNSTDIEGPIATYQWKQTSGPAAILSGANTSQASFTAPVVGPQGEVLKFELAVTDSSGFRSTDTCIINVTWRNDPPFANAGADQMINEAMVVILDGSASSDPDDGIATYVWTQISGPVVMLSGPSSVNPMLRAPSVGLTGVTLKFQLEVTDVGGLKAVDTVVVNVSNVNQPPVANAGSGQTVMEGNTVVLRGTGSYDPDGTISIYRWKQLTGVPVALSNAMSATSSFVAPQVSAAGATMSFELTVVDDGGLSGTAAADVIITNTTAPVIVSPYYGQTGCVMEPTISIDSSSVPDMYAHAYTQWRISKTAAFSSLILDVTSSVHLVELPVPHTMLDASTTYYVSARFFDSNETPSGWSNPVQFTTGADADDANMNGIPDQQEVSWWKDLNRDRIVDARQPATIKDAIDRSNNFMIGVEKASSSVTEIVKLELLVGAARTVALNAADFLTPQTVWSNIAIPGLFSYRAKLSSPGATGKFRVYFPMAVASNAVFYKYDTINGWQDFSEHTTIGADGRSIVLEIQDGGFGDADGVANGVIVDPGLLKP